MNFNTLQRTALNAYEGGEFAAATTTEGLPPLLRYILEELGEDCEIEARENHQQPTVVAISRLSHATWRIDDIRQVLGLA